MLTRFDFTKNQRDLLNTAVSCGLVDAIELACMVTNHGNNMDAILNELSETCWALRNGSDAEQETRSIWIDACNYFHFIEDDQSWQKAMRSHNKEQYKDWRPTKPTPHDPYGLRKV